MNALDLSIKQLGGVGKLATAIGVGQAVVSNWRARNTVIDAVYCVAIESATDGIVTRRDLRPDDWQKIWPELVEESACMSSRPNPDAVGIAVVMAGDALGYNGLKKAA